MHIGADGEHVLFMVSWFSLYYYHRKHVVCEPDGKIESGESVYWIGINGRNPTYISTHVSGGVDRFDEAVKASMREEVGGR